MAEIEGTVINYPVMYTPHDEEYYLNRDFYGKSSSNGTLFVDADCTFNPVSDNIIIYGHNKSNGSMFSGLLNYRDKDFYRNNRIIRFDTIYGKGSYEIIAVFYSRVYRKSDNVFKFYNFIDAASKEEFDTFIRNIKALSIHDTGVEAEYGDKLITLCTCTNDGNNGRFVLVAKKVAYEPFNRIPKQISTSIRQTLVHTNNGTPLISAGKFSCVPCDSYSLIAYACSEGSWLHPGQGSLGRARRCPLLSRLPSNLP